MTKIDQLAREISLGYIEHGVAEAAAKRMAAAMLKELEKLTLRNSTMLFLEAVQALFTDEVKA